VLFGDAAFTVFAARPFLTPVVKSLLNRKAGRLGSS
jgi:hypothetical protein